LLLLCFSGASEVTLPPAEGVAEANALEAFDAEGADIFRVFSTVEAKAPDAEGAAEALALVLVEVVGGAEVTTTEGFALALVVVTGGKDATTEVATEVTTGVATEVVTRALALADNDAAAEIVAVAGNVLDAIVTTADALVVVGTPEGPLNKPVGAGADGTRSVVFARSPSEAVSRPSEVSMG